MHVLYKYFPKNWRLWTGFMLSAGTSYIWVNTDYFLPFVFLLQVYFLCWSIKFFLFPVWSCEEGAEDSNTVFTYIFCVST